jgi:DNA-binding CsgD family transcriptional regulator
MPPTRSLDRGVLDLVSHVIGVLEVDELCRVLLEAMVETVPADWVSLNDIGPEPGDVSVLVRPSLSTEQMELFATLSHENPLLQRWLRTRDGRAYRFSDVATSAELQELELFRRFYNTLGVRHQIAFTLPSSPERVLAVALSREQEDFSDFERDLINEARPFLIGCYRAAVEHSRLAAGASLPEVPAGAGLTKRQAEILGLVARGLSNATVAGRLGISPRTVSKHLERAYRVLGASSRSQAAELVWRGQVDS